jgi:hypothetical protein
MPLVLLISNPMNRINIPNLRSKKHANVILRAIAKFKRPFMFTFEQFLFLFEQSLS